MLSTKSLTASQRLYAELKLDAPDPANQTKAKQRSGKQASKTVGCSTLNLALADPGGRASSRHLLCYGGRAVKPQICFTCMSIPIICISRAQFPKSTSYEIKETSLSDTKWLSQKQPKLQMIIVQSEKRPAANLELCRSPPAGQIIF